MVRFAGHLLNHLLLNSVAMVEKCSVVITPDILEFVAHNKIASVCCCEDNKPHCFNCFYSVLEDEGCIVYKSSEDTVHMRILTGHNKVAGTIIDSDISLARIVGMQFEGIRSEDEHLLARAAKSYYLRYPLAIAMPGKLWVLEMHGIKYTSTINGIKRKMEWHRA